MITGKRIDDSQHTELPEENVTLVEKAYRHIKMLIVSAKLPPGEPISEVQMCNELAISRTPVREAIHQLEHDGLIVRYPNRGSFVRQLAVKEFLEIWQIRECLEPLACELAVRKIDKSALRELQGKLLDLQKERVDFEEHETRHDIDIKLHSLILEATGNETMKKLVDGLSSRIMYIRMVHNSDRFQSSVAEHLEIISGLLDGHPIMASNAMRRHLANGRENISSM